MNHPGFKNVAAGIAKKEGLSFERAKAILAASSRRAGPAAKKANPNLKRVKG
jgi:cytochrome c551/c552